MSHDHYIRDKRRRLAAIEDEIVECQGEIAAIELLRPDGDLSVDEYSRIIALEDQIADLMVRAEELRAHSYEEGLADHRFDEARALRKGED